jgi:hypothetical protein
MRSYVGSASGSYGLLFVGISRIAGTGASNWSMRYRILAATCVSRAPADSEGTGMLPVDELTRGGARQSSGRLAGRNRRAYVLADQNHGNITIRRVLLESVFHVAEWCFWRTRQTTSTVSLHRR